MQRKSWNEHKKKISEGNVKLRVIGAGLPRTGTTSLKTALEILGFGPCHHMEEMFKKPSRIKEFIRALDGENVDFRKLMEGYGSTLDSPTMEFYKEIHQAYPQAKIILTVRENGEKWFNSFQNTILTIATSKFYHFCVYLIPPLREQYKLGGKNLIKWRNEYGEIGPLLYDKHNKRVLDENKDSDVLVFNVKEGWEPLCKFLNVEIPENIPFPNVNDANEIKRKIIFAKAVGLFTWSIVGGLVIFSTYFVLQMK